MPKCILHQQKEKKLLLILGTGGAGRVDPSGLFAALASSSHGRCAAGWDGTGRETTLSIISGTIALLITSGKDFRREGLEKVKVWRASLATRERLAELRGHPGKG